MGSGALRSNGERGAGHYGDYEVMGRGHYEVMDYEVMERGGERGALRSNGHYAVMGGGALQSNITK
jgi:hypothetical protein